MKRSSIVVISVQLVTVGFLVGIFAHHKYRAHDKARNTLKSKIPGYAEKVENAVAKLKSETPSESISNLDLAIDYFSPGGNEGWVHLDIPLHAGADQPSIDQIMSNRRFRKTFDELRETKKAVASQIVRSNLTSAITNYLALYDADLQAKAIYHKRAKERKQPYIDGPGYFITPKTGEEGKKLLLGQRLQILSLVWISGMLNLKDNKDQVEQVVRLALKQRADIYNDSTFEDFFKSRLLDTASLYNRQILSSALLGVSGTKADVQAKAMKAADVRWVECKLAAYDAAVTEFDKPVQSGAMAPDYSTGSIKVKFVSPMSDTNFDLLLKEIHFK